MLKNLFIALLGLPAFAFAQVQFVAPMPGSGMQNPERNIVLRPGDLLDHSSLSKSFFSVTGSVSGAHDFKLVLANDGKTINLNPVVPFAYGETVTVCMKNGVRRIDGNTCDGFSFSFSIHRQYTAAEKQRLLQADLKTSEARLSTEITEARGSSESQPAPDFKILVNDHATAGKVFFANNDLECIKWIVNNEGDSVYKKAAVSSGFAFTLNNNGYMTAWNDSGFYQMYDSNYLRVKIFKVINGYLPNAHEFQIFPDGRYFLIGDDDRIVDMTVYDQSYQSDAVVTGNVLQEFDADDNLIFEWNTFDHIDILEALHVNFTSGIIDAVHMNSIDLDFDGNILISSRHLDQIDKINLSTGDFIWRLGGINNEFTFTNDPDRFNSQHDVRRIPNGNITLFNNNGWGASPKMANVKEYQLDEVNKTATLVWSYAHPMVEGQYLTSGAMGGAQRLFNGHTIICWGVIPLNLLFPNITEVDENNKIVWELQYERSEAMYRARRALWNPCARPSDSRLTATNVQKNKATLNWNAATNAVKYKVQYRQKGATTWKSKVLPGNLNSVTLGNLSAGTIYNWQMQTWCNSSGGHHSGFTAIKSFKTENAVGSSAFASPETETLDGIAHFPEIFPNPATDRINLFWIQQNRGEANTIIQIINGVGQVVMSQKVDAAEGENRWQGDIQSLPAGRYLVRIISMEKQYQSGFNKQ